MKKSGFTLLELIMVMSLVTLILSLSGVFFVGFLPSAKLDAAGRELSGVIRQARSLARMDMARRTVVIDLDNGSYGIEGRETRALPPETVIRVIDPLSGELRQGKYLIVFHPTGGAAGGTIVLSRGKKKVTIFMDPITAAVAIKGGAEDYR